MLLPFTELRNCFTVCIWRSCALLRKLWAENRCYKKMSYFVDHLIRVTANKNKKKLFYLVHFLRLKSYHLSHVSYHKPNPYFCPSSLRVLKSVLFSQLKAAVRENKSF